MSDEGCICKGNWRAIVKESTPLLGKWFEGDGHRWLFSGVVWGEDDLYYLMWRPVEGLGHGTSLMLSCVGSIKTHGYTACEPPSTRSD